MKLICEYAEQPKLIVEAGAGGVKQYFIEGIFMQGDVKNKNGRTYPTAILARETKRYLRDYINENRAYGELGHPDGPTINMERVSHMIKSLTQDGNNFIGRAKIMDTPMGQIVKNFLDEGAKIAVSSRGMGNLRERGGYQEVMEDYFLSTPADIVADPSAPSAFVNGIMESREWIWNNGIFKEAKLEKAKRRVEKASGTVQGLSTAVQLDIFESFLASQR